jgi:pimeloyl-ACP methyl ester carboxylesterase
LDHKATPDGDVRLFLWEKYVGSPEGKPAVLFVHGSSMASQPTFDLTVPGRPDSSAMDWFARRGFVCWCVDMEGYGRSDKTRDIFCDIANGADDLAAATDYIVKTRGIRAFMAVRHLVRGAARRAIRPAPPRARGAPCPRRLRLDRRRCADTAATA